MCKCIRVKFFDVQCPNQFVIELLHVSGCRLKTCHLLLLVGFIGEAQIMVLPKIKYVGLLIYN